MQKSSSGVSLLSDSFFFFLTGEFMARVPSTRRNENPRANAYKNLFFLISWVHLGLQTHIPTHVIAEFVRTLQRGRFSFKRDFLTSDTVLKAGGVLYYFR